jgi:hypothetical protein
MPGEADDLELIPRVVRDKLDRVGIKLHLKDWQFFSLAERRGLCDRPCESAEEVGLYRRALEELLFARTGRPPEYLGRSSDRQA